MTFKYIFTVSSALLSNAFGFIGHPLDMVPSIIANGGLMSSSVPVAAAESLNH